MSNTEEKIACPKCTWEPDGKPYWRCHCGCIWNTFDTYGKCPDCGFVHKKTQCISCAQLSPHPDWYLDLDGIELELEIKEAVVIEK
ncbi:hypothetical protein [Chondrinema litorale]|uniref:hypothetical protein n=1 Tax=Chondrinema litorale TaxID=2994555 RepID=UPI0025435524|nr:hypothetical protein [Chondrinema litorale]UZR94134.1 hypothetical protein OQ292_20025 [Chondrinema litorale]